MALCRKHIRSQMLQLVMSLFHTFINWNSKKLHRVFVKVLNFPSSVCACCGFCSLGQWGRSMLLITSGWCTQVWCNCRGVNTRSQSQCSVKVLTEKGKIQIQIRRNSNSPSYVATAQIRNSAHLTWCPHPPCVCAHWMLLYWPNRAGDKETSEEHQVHSKPPLILNKGGKKMLLMETIPPIAH